MKPAVFLFLLNLFCANVFAYQDASSKQSRIILAKVKALPEVKEWLNGKSKGQKRVLQLNEPANGSKLYGVQVGLDGLGMFRTNYWLYVDPKTYQIYYWDSLDTGSKNITLEQWRYWRTKPGFNRSHYYKNGKLIVLKD